MSELPTVRVVSSEYAPSHTSLLGPLGVVLVVLATGQATYSVLHARLVSKFRSSDISVDFEEIVTSMQSLGRVFQPCLLACWTVVAVIAFVMWRRLDRGRVASLGLAAFLAISARVIVDASLLVADYVKSDWVARFLLTNKPGTAALLVVFTVGPALLLWLLHARTAQERRSPVVWLGLAALALQLVRGLYQSFSGPASGGNEWIQVFLSTGSFVTAILVAAWLAWSERKNQVFGGTAIGADWSMPSRGLRLYQQALVWRLVLTVAGYGLLFIAIKGRSQEMAETLSWAGSLVAIVTGAFMTVGVFRFANQPVGTPGRGAAFLAGSLMAIALVIDLSLFASLLEVLSVDRSLAGYGDLSAAVASLEAAQSMAVWGMALSIAAFVALITSFRGVAHALDEGRLATQAYGVGVTVVLVGALAWGLRYWLSTASRVTLDSAIFAGLGILVAILVVVVSHLDLVGKLNARLAFACVEESTAGHVSGPESP